MNGPFHSTFHPPVAPNVATETSSELSIFPVRHEPQAKKQGTLRARLYVPIYAIETTIQLQL